MSVREIADDPKATVWVLIVGNPRDDDLAARAKLYAGRGVWECGFAQRRLRDATRAERAVQVPIGLEAHRGEDSVDVGHTNRDDLLVSRLDRDPVRDVIETDVYCRDAVVRKGGVEAARRRVPNEDEIVRLGDPGTSGEQDGAVRAECHGHRVLVSAGDQIDGSAHDTAGSEAWVQAPVRVESHEDEILVAASLRRMSARTRRRGRWRS